jgi:drug/metabolite transporter (DMT)-like permease
MGPFIKLVLLFSAIVVNVAAQGFMRYAFTHTSAGAGGVKMAHLVELAHMPAAWTGLFLQGVGFLLWLGVISRLELTYAFPVAGSLFTLLIFAQGYFILHEAVTPMRCVGAALVVIGAVLVGRSG